MHLRITFLSAMLCLFTISSPSYAANWLSSLPCEDLLKADSTVELLLHHLFLEAKRQLHQRLVDTNNSYDLYVETQNPNSVQASMAGIALDSTWSLHIPAKDQEIWPKLTSVQKLSLLDGLEKAFAQGVYDTEIAPPEDDKRTLLQQLVSFKTHQALTAKPNLAFSPLLFLGGALNSRLIGVCRHYNLALAGLLRELGLPIEDLKVISAKDPRDQHSHLYLEVRIGNDWLLSDILPHKYKNSNPSPLSFSLDQSNKKLDYESHIWFRQTLVAKYKSDYSLNRLEYSFDSPNTDRNYEDTVVDDFLDDLIKVMRGNKLGQPTKNDNE